MHDGRVHTSRMLNNSPRFRRIQPLAIVLALTTAGATFWPAALPLLVAAAAVFLAGVILVAADLIVAEIEQSAG